MAEITSFKQIAKIILTAIFNVGIAIGILMAFAYLPFLYYHGLVSYTHFVILSLTLAGSLGFHIYRVAGKWEF